MGKYPGQPTQNITLEARGGGTFSKDSSSHLQYTSQPDGPLKGTGRYVHIKNRKIVNNSSLLSPLGGLLHMYINMIG